MEDKKKVEIPEKLLQVVDEERLNKVLKQVEQIEEEYHIEQGVTKEVLNMMKGKRVCDTMHTIIALAQAQSVWVLHSIYDTLALMLRRAALKEIMAKLEVEKAKENTTSEE
jgi:hypothetical protein